MTLPPIPTQETRLSRLQYRRHLRVFPLTGPSTVFVRGSNCRVIIHYHDLNHVELHAGLYAAFGMRLIVDQDDAGVYVVVKRRHLWGLFSRSELTVKLPNYCHLTFSLTPGEVRVEQVNGTLEIPPAMVTPPKSMIEVSKAKVLPEHALNRLGSGK